MKKIVRSFSRIIVNNCVILTAILLLGFAARLYKIDIPLADWHSWRQSDTAAVTRIYVDYGINPLVPKYYDISSIQSGFFNPNGYRFVEFPVYNIIHALLVKYTGIFNLEIWGRLLSSLMSVGSAVTLYLLGKRFISKRGGLLAAFYYLFIPYNIFFSRTILPEPTACFLALSALYFFVLHMDTKKYLPFFVSALFFALAILVKPHTIFFAVPMFYLLWNEGHLQKIHIEYKILIKYLIFGTLVILPFLLWRAWENGFAAGIPHLEWSFNGGLIRFRPAFWRWIFVERVGKLILASWGTVLLVLGIIHNNKKGMFAQFFLFGMFLYVSVFAAANVRHDYYQYYIIPSIALALAKGADYIITSDVFHRILAYLSVFAVSILFIFGGWYQIKDFYQINHPEIIKAGQIVKEMTPKDARIIAPYNGDTAFLYQTERFGWPAVDTSFEKLIEERGADYFVAVNFSDPDVNYVRNNYEVVYEDPDFILADLHKPIN